VWQVAGSLGIAIGQTYLTDKTALHLAENAGVVTPAQQPVQSAIAALGTLLQQHGLPASGANVLLAQLADRSAEIQAYGDTFVFSAVILAIATPLALFLGHRPAKQPVVRRDGGL
jgi:hypothetical protein